MHTHINSLHQHHPPHTEQCPRRARLCRGRGSNSTIILIVTTPVATGVYDLVYYNGGISGLGLAGLNLAFANPLAHGTLITNAAGTALQLNLTDTGVLLWNGNIPPGNWDLSGSNQWIDSGTSLPAAFANGAEVAFTDSATTFTVNIVTNVLPANVIVGATNNYTFQGPGGILGPAQLTQNGPGTLTLDNNNEYTGGTTINGGVLQLAGGAFLYGPILDDSVFELSLTNTNGVFFTNLITGTGSLSNSGPGVVTIIATNTYTGGTTNSFGWLQYTNTMGASGEVVGAAPFRPRRHLLG